MGWNWFSCLYGTNVWFYQAGNQKSLGRGLYFLTEILNEK